LGRRALRTKHPCITPPFAKGGRPCCPFRWVGARLLAGPLRPESPIASWLSRRHGLFACSASRVIPQPWYAAASPQGRKQNTSIGALAPPPPGPPLALSSAEPLSLKSIQRMAPQCARPCAMGGAHCSRTLGGGAWLCVASPCLGCSVRENPDGEHRLSAGEGTVVSVGGLPSFGGFPQS
jgi:hypothetical protein